LHVRPHADVHAPFVQINADIQQGMPHRLQAAGLESPGNRSDFPARMSLHGATRAQSAALWPPLQTACIEFPAAPSGLLPTAPDPKATWSPAASRTRYDMRTTMPAHLSPRLTSLEATRPHSGWLRRRSARLLAGTTLAITGCLAIAVPAHAATVNAVAAPAASRSAASAPGDFTAASTTSAMGVGREAVSPVHIQSLDVSDTIAAPRLVEETFTAIPPNVPQLLQQAAPQTDATTLASTATALGTAPGQRLTIVGAALSYLGTPYVLDGASRSGIDCSGLIMVAYQAVGIGLSHYVPTQDSAGHAISAADARPGDLVVFDDEEHVGMYLGNGLLVAAPEPGRDVQIEPVSAWSGIGYHFTRLLGD
jgi:peptidoglycan DL-endopeptidase CwlO